MPERVVELLELRGLTQTALARLAGVEQPSINRVIKGKTTKPRFLHEIAKALGTSTGYLLGETDDPLPLTMSEPRLAYRGPEPDQRLAPAAQVVPVREIDLTLGMGARYLDVPVTETVRHFSRDWIRQYTRAAPEHLLFAQGVGDSMKPTLEDSDLLLIDCSQQTLNMADKIWAISYADCGSVKRLRPVPGGGVEILSDNPAVPTATAYDGELHILGRVVAVVRKM